MIKKYLDRNSFAFPGFEKEEKKQSLTIVLALAITFIIASFTFFNFLYVFCDFVGSIVSGNPDCAIRDMLRSLPILLTTLQAIHLLTLFHNVQRNENVDNTIRIIKRNSIVVLAHSVICVLYVVVGLISGKYSSIVEGAPSALYPLDVVIFALAYAFISIMLYKYATVGKDKYPLIVPCRAPSIKKGVERGFHHFFMTLLLLHALYGFAAFLYSPFVMDWGHGHGFYCIIQMFVFITPAIYFLVWEFYYNELKEENRKNLLFIAIVGLIYAFVLFGLYFLAYNLDPQAPILACFGLLAVDYTASVNATFVLYNICILVTPIVALIKGLKLKKQ